MAGSAWTNQLVNLIILSAAQSGFSGFFTYSPAPGAGNLIASEAAVPGVDRFGNHYLANTTTYGAGFAASLAAGNIQFYTGSLSGGWTASGSIQSDTFGDIFLLAATGRSVTTNNNTLDDGSGNMTVAGTLTVGGSSQTGTGLPAGVPTGGPNGAVFAGHTHDFDGHTHNL